MDFLSAEILLGRPTKSPLQLQSSPFNLLAGGFRGLQLDPARQLAKGAKLTIIKRDDTLELFDLVPTDHLFPIRNHISDPDPV